MLNFSRAAADKYNLHWNKLPTRSGDYWRIDLTKIGRIQILLIVHERTLATLVRRRSDFKTLDAITREIKTACPWYAGSTDTSCGKNTNRSLVGTLTEMKRIASYYDPANELSEIEKQLNLAPYSYLSDKKNGMDFPKYALERYIENPSAAQPAPPANKKRNAPIAPPKGFSTSETEAITAAIEKHIWSKRRPPLHLRDQVREGQRISGYTIELFLSRPFWDNPKRRIEESIAKIKYIKKHDHWRLYWQRADLKWHAYPELPIADSLDEALQTIDADEYCCFWG